MYKIQLLEISGAVRDIYIYIYDISRLRVKSRIVMTKAAFNKKRALFVSKMDLEMR
jgi:hypothetical protein